MEELASNDRSIIECDDPYYGLTCSRHQITKDDREIYGRPRAELSYSQRGFEIGGTCVYRFKLLIPADLRSFDIDGEPSSTAIAQFHQAGNLQPGVPFMLNVHGSEIRCTGYSPDGSAGGRWFDGIYDTYIPGEWTNWEIRVKWSLSEDGSYKVDRDGDRVYEKTGQNCVPDARGAPWFRWGPHLNKSSFENRQQGYIRLYFKDVILERIE